MYQTQTREYVSSTSVQMKWFAVCSTTKTMIPWSLYQYMLLTTSAPWSAEPLLLSMFPIIYNFWLHSYHKVWTLILFSKPWAIGVVFKVPGFWDLCVSVAAPSHCVDVDLLCVMSWDGSVVSHTNREFSSSGTFEEASLMLVSPCLSLNHSDGLVLLSLMMWMEKCSHILHKTGIVHILILCVLGHLCHAVQVEICHC
jgi:hypothetical protein